MDREKNKTGLEAVDYVLNCEAQEIQNLTRTLNPQQLEMLMQALKKCKGKIITTGCGTSGAAAKKVAHTFNCIEMPALYLSPAEALHGGMGVIQKEDVVIFFSKGGHTSELKPIVQASKVKQALSVAVTEAEKCYLTEYSDMVLKVKISQEPDQFNMLATASTLGVIAVFDAIAIALANEKGYTKEEFLLIHPGGEVGERLLTQTEKMR